MNPSRDRHRLVAPSIRARRTVEEMQLPPAFLRRLGAAGARDNAWRACEEYRLALVQVDALAGRLVLRRSIEVADGPDRPSQPGRELAPAHDPAASRVAG